MTRINRNIEYLKWWDVGFSVRFLCWQRFDRSEATVVRVDAVAARQP